MKISKLLMSILIWSTTIKVYSQGTSPNNKIQLPDFQDPQAASLGKYGVYPTAEYTGALPISIPLFEINAKGYRIPFSLSFHGSGIKLNQMETEVGLGWSLSGLGVISRSIMGIADEKEKGSSRIIPKTGPEIMNNATLPYTASQSDIMSKRVWLKAMSEGAGEDTHTDYYFYNFPGHSGKFIVANKTNFIPVPFSPVKIERGPISNDLYNSSTFKITDEIGAISTFGSYTYSTPENFEPLSKNATISSWYLDNISIPHRNENINFQYEDFFVDESTAYQEQSVGYNMGADGSLSGIQSFINSKSGKLTHRMKLIKQINYGDGKIIFNYMTSPNLDVSPMKFLKEILIYNKLDALIKKVILDYTIPANRVKLTKVTSVDLLNSAQNGIHEIFYNSINFPARSGGPHTSDYWGYFNNQGFGLIAQKSVKRSSINLSADGESSWIDYDIPIGNANREINENVNQAEMISKIVYPTKGFTTFEFESNKFLNRQLTSSDVRANYGGYITGKGSNTKSEAVYNFKLDSTNIIKPFSGKPKINITFGPPTPINGAVRPYTQFVTLTDVTANTVLFTKYHDSNPSLPLTFSQELNLINNHEYQLVLTVYGVSSYVNGNMTSSIDAYVTWTSNQNIYGEVPRLAGGLRIKKVENFDADSKRTGFEEYNYGKNGDGIGKRLYDPNIFFKDYQDYQYYTFYQTFSSGTAGASPTHIGRFWERKYFGVTEYSSIGLNGCPVFYDYVTKYTNSVQSSDKIKEVRQYQLNGDKTFESLEFLNSKNYGAFSYLLNTPVLSNEIAFDSDNRIIKNKAFKYSYLKGTNYTPALVFEQKIFVDPSSGVTGGYILDYNIVSDFRISGSNIRNSLFLPILEEEKEYIYKDGLVLDSIFTSKNMSYNSAYNIEPSEIKISRSDTKDKKIKFFYPDDITTTALLGGNLLTGQLQSIQRLNKSNDHRVNEPIQIEEYTDNNLISIDRNIYADFSGKIRLNDVLKKQQLLNFENRLKFFNYDIYGNPIEVKEKERSSTVYLWGYGGQYPVFEIKNATYAEVVIALTQATIDNLNSSSQTEAGIETLIKNASDKLRSNLPQAMVTSYTYKPLVGMTSKTDARGITEYYKYDGMQRLQAILDHLNNVNRSFDYHYRSN